jgi:hypothetical protein
MALTENNYVGNGSTVLYSFTFPYLATSDIKVSLDGVTTTSYTLANATTVQFNAAPTNGTKIRIYRETADGSLSSTFYPGSSIRSQDLNNNFTQNLYVTQEARNTSAAATTTAAGAVTSSNTALSQSAAAVSTANTASTNASAAVSTANTASANASTAVSTANTASANATTAVNTANSATTTANNATSTANSATSTANTALSTANTALTNANAAVSTANTASTNASAAVSTANTASTNSSAAVTTANTASTNASTAVTTANSAVTTANAAAAAVANAVLYTTVANVAAIPASPANNAAVEVTNSTGIESFTPLSGLPAGFVGSSGLSVRIIYQTVGSTWTWIQYFPNDPENRYFKLSGGTITGPITVPQGTVSSPGVKFSGTGNDNTGVYSPGIDELGLVTNGVNRLSIDSAGAVAIPGTLGVTGAITGSLTGAASSNVLKAGDTMTGNLTAPAFIPNGSTVPTNGVYLPSANNVAISTNGTGRLFVDSSGLIGAGAAPSIYRLDVTGNGIRTREGANSSALVLGTYDAGGYAYITSDKIGTGSYQPLAFFTNGSERLRLTTTGALNFVGAGTAGSTQAVSFNGSAPVNSLVIDSSGRVGLGTSSPSYLLDVNGTIGAGTAGGVAIQLANGAAIRNSAAVANTIYFDTSFGSATHGSFEFRSSNAGTTRMLIDSSGRVGIGTSSPATLLDLSSTTAAKLNLTYPGFGIATLASDSTGALLLQADEANTQASSLIQFKVDGSERVRIDSSGRVGIGTQTPSWIFDVKTATGYIGFNTSGGLGSQIRFANSSNVNTAAISNNGGSNELLQFDINNNAGAGQIVFNTVGSERARIDSSGRLLVNTSSYDGNARAVFAGNTSDNATGAIDIRRNTARPTAANTQIGALRFISNDNTSSNYGYASIDVFTDGASSSNTDIPGRLVFSTTADGASSPTERMRIANDGSISSVIPGGSTLYPRFGCRAWVNFNGTGTVAIRASGNVSSITDNGTGDYTVNFTSALADANYSTVVSAGRTTGGAAIASPSYSAAPTVNGVQIAIYNTSGTLTDVDRINVAVFR